MEASTTKADIRQWLEDHAQPPVTVARLHPRSLNLNLGLPERALHRCPTKDNINIRILQTMVSVLQGPYSRPCISWLQDAWI